MAKKIIVANPPWYYKDKHGKFWFGIRSGSRWPFSVHFRKDYINRYRPFPFWLAYAYSVLEKNNIDVHWLDSITLGDTYTLFFEKVKSIAPDYLFFEMTTPSIENDIFLINELHSLGIKVLVGGAHASVFYKELLKIESIYAIFIGQYEFSLLDFFNSGCVRGIYESREFNLDDLPFPYRDDNIWLYRERTHDMMPFQISMLTSRGCPFNCIFCQWPRVMYRDKVKFRSIENIENEVKYLVNRYGDDIFIYFDDDTFNLNEDRTIEISKILKKYGLLWSAMCRIDTISEDGWIKLIDNGLYSVNVGIESANKNVLQSIGKKLDIIEAKERIKMLVKRGVYVHLTFTYGVPGETEEAVKETKNFFEEVGAQSKQESKCIPLPGTIWWDTLDETEREKYLSNMINFDGYFSLRGGEP